MTEPEPPFSVGDRVTFGGSWVGTVLDQWQEVFPARPREAQWVVMMRCLTDKKPISAMRAENLRLVEKVDGSRG